MKKLKRKKRFIFIFAIPLLLIIAGVAFFQFTPIGYCMTVQFRSFTEVEPNIFIHNDYSFVTTNENNELVGKDDIPAIINEARNRVAEFFGEELQSDPVFIISDNSKIYKRTGERIIYRFVLHDVFSYIAVSYRHLNVDILAHEITHAELYYRVMNGKSFRFSFDKYIPIWFDEGLASINDHRSMMNEEALNRKIEMGTEIIDVTTLTKADFQGTHVNDSFFNTLIIQEYYLFSRHKVLGWINENGIDALLRLIDEVRDGKDFYDLYNNSQK
jgi:hypothetical protein